MSAGACPRCGDELHEAEPDVGIPSPGCPSCHWYEGCEERAQPFRAADVVEVLLGPHQGERWVLAVYESDRDTAWIAGWPCTMVTKATEALRLVERASDEKHAEMIEAVGKMRGDHGDGDPRRRALEHMLARGQTP